MVSGIRGGRNGNDDAGSPALQWFLDFNAESVRLYGSRFLDLRRVLLATGASGGKYADPTECAPGRLPTAIRGDRTVRFNATGCTDVANLVNTKGKALGDWAWPSPLPQTKRIGTADLGCSRPAPLNQTITS